jgi:CRP-like cAMP-binding protein
MFTRHHDPIAARLRALDLPREAADRLSKGGTLIELEAGSTLCEKGERGTQAFLLVEGQADVLLSDQVVTVGPGEVVGEIATLDQHRTRNATVRAATDVLVLVFDPATYRGLARDEALRERLVPQRTAA